MRLSSATKGILFAPTLICLFFILKAFCPESAGDACFADQFAVPIFLPLIAVYRLFGSSDIILGQEFLFVLIYWSFVGFLVGFILDLYTHQSQYLPEQHPPL